MRMVVAGTGVTQAVADLAYEPLARGGEIVSLCLAGLAYVDASVEKVAYRIDEPVDLIGHSQGGLVAALVAKRYPELVRSLVTIGAPIKGVPLAKYTPWAPLRSMVKGSSACKELLKLPFDRTLTIAGRKDRLVPISSALPWFGCDYAIFDLGHLELIWDEKVLYHIHDWLDPEEVLAA